MLSEVLKFISTQEPLGISWTPLREAQMSILCFYMHLNVASLHCLAITQFEHPIASALEDTVSLPSISYFIAALEYLQGS